MSSRDFVFMLTFVIALGTAFNVYFYTESVNAGTATFCFCLLLIMLTTLIVTPHR